MEGPFALGCLHGLTFGDLLYLYRPECLVQDQTRLTRVIAGPLGDIYTYGEASNLEAMASNLIAMASRPPLT